MLVGARHPGKAMAFNWLGSLSWSLGLSMWLRETHTHTHTGKSAHTHTRIHTLSLDEWKAWLASDWAAGSHVVRKRRVMAVQRSLQTKQTQTTRAHINTHSCTYTHKRVTSLRSQDWLTPLRWRLRRAAAMISAEMIIIAWNRKMSATERQRERERERERGREREREREREGGRSGVRIQRTRMAEWSCNNMSLGHKLHIHTSKVIVSLSVRVCVCESVCVCLEACCAVPLC